MRKDSKKIECLPIKLPIGQTSKLAEEFRCTYATVNNALNFKTDSCMSRAIRARALRIVDEYMDKHGVGQSND